MAPVHAASLHRAATSVLHAGDGSDGRDAWVDIGADEAALDAVGYPTVGAPWWTWRVVLDAHLQLQGVTDFLPPATWENLSEPFTTTDQIWTQKENFVTGPIRFYRLL